MGVWGCGGLRVVVGYGLWWGEVFVEFVLVMVMLC